MSISKLWFNEYKKRIAIVVGILIIGIVALVFSRESSNEVISQEWELEKAGNENLEPEVGILENDLHFIIDVKGNVRSPGIYEAEEGERVLDVIMRAGGFIDESDAAFLNLAEKLRDEMVIVVGGSDDGPLQQLSQDATGASSGTDKININVATDSELQTLPGIGPSKAQSIVTYREENGAFQSVEDIVYVSGIGEKSLESLRDLIDIK
ncbi:helix-hairpin-helix domain-containing protein [Paenalkalicoccus suaedae]|uniref:Helix-hairpin-helix domain-containing protein n=1 Tax=Paenalkalicoccus suaedae TaxID=2592382 RepID=A0A859FCP6_9BACI|nr:helix-hairpin-helix domain-containing protein [Paenalkalicoccus suaedae]QKS70837.1 helix-hairpin-helix domain-containing protein [Paenalkalicoccus suaedae]